VVVVHGKLSGALRGAAPAGALRASKFIPDELLMSLSGEICLACVPWHHWSRTEGRSERAGFAIEPYGDPGSASCGNAWRDEPKSANGIVAERPP